MNKINPGKFLLGGVVSSLICFASDGFLHEKILKADWMEVWAALHAVSLGHNPYTYAYFGFFELGRGFLGIFIYILMRARYGATPRTAVLAGVVSWGAFCLAGPAQFIPLGFFSVALWVKGGMFQLLTSGFSTLAGAALYQEKKRRV